MRFVSFFRDPLTELIYFQNPSLLIIILLTFTFASKSDLGWDHQQNGFGGVSRGMVAFTPGSDDHAWSRKIMSVHRGSR